MYGVATSAGAIMTVSLDSLKETAEELLQRYGQSRVWLFSGEMGAGKTTLIKALCQSLGVQETMSSPTFSIINEYERGPGAGGGKVYHFDFYRLKNEQEAYDLGVEEYLESGDYCFVEWPEKITSLVPNRHVEIKLMPKDASHRILHHRIHE